MGRAARECTEPRGDCSGRAEPSSLRRRDRAALAVPSIDPSLEPTADLLARREQRVVPNASWRELHDPYRLVAVAVTPCVRRRFIERLQTLTLPPRPCHHQTPSTYGPAWEPGRSAGFRTLQTKPAVPLGPGLAGPGAPIPARGDEVAMCCLRLCEGGRAMPEDPALARAHLEEALILAVLRVRAQARLTS